MIEQEKPEGEEVQQLEEKNEKKRMKPFSLKPESFENRNGLQKLYELTNHVKWDDLMPLESAMNTLGVTLKTWHYQIAPKYSFDLLLQRCQALGSNKIVSVNIFR